MQQLRIATNGRATPARCSRELLAGVPSIMRFIRAQMRRHRKAELTVPQFRALVFVSLHDDASLSALAEHLGLSAPAASRMVDLLVKRSLMLRQTRSTDRRSVALSLTARGKTVFRTAMAATEIALAERFRTLSGAELDDVSRGLALLARVFSAENGSNFAGRRRV